MCVCVRGRDGCDSRVECVKGRDGCCDSWVECVREVLCGIIQVQRGKVYVIKIW